MALRRNVNPVLEKLRNEVEGPPNVDTLTQDLQRMTENVHAAYLFENEGASMLRQLCLLLSATAAGKLYSGWQEFAAKLGLSLEQIQCIDYNFKGLQDPTYYVLLAFVQSPDGTLDKILLALQKIGRLDVVNRIHESISRFTESLNLKTNRNEIQRPRYIPRAPIVLCPMSIRDEAPTKQFDSMNSLYHQHLKKPKQQYACKVMLTYAQDGAVTAKNTAKIFRAKNIGVVILQEQEKHVYSGAEEFIDACLRQVNYIIPILTTGYIEHVNSQLEENYMEKSLDIKYLKYIYTLMRAEYRKNNNCNYRVRCIVPESRASTVLKSNLHPILQSWFREADIEKFMENILLKKI